MTLPIDDVLPELLEAVSRFRNVVLCAPPGAGKTTRVPLALVNTGFLQNKRIIMLEPRRLAARRAAEFMAASLDQSAGALVGYRTRGESRVSASTRIEVVTEGILTRLLHETPELPDVGMILFDEFHERSIHADLGLAFALDVQQHLREDLRILVMSATIDGVAVAGLLHDAPVIESSGKSYSVETTYLSFPHTGHMEPKIAEVIGRALRDQETGDILVFLPGQREIRRTENLLRSSIDSARVTIHMLFSDAPDVLQRAALAPAKPGYRKVILSTSVAETSLTIDGVSIVVDAGLARSSQFDPRRGMSGLVTMPVSKAAADQRRGRAGRQSAGVCYRLWTEEQHRQLAPFAAPEILSADLAPFLLDVARWGMRDITGLKLLSDPPDAHLEQARRLLRLLDAIDDDGRLTTHGRTISSIAVHPRLGHMMTRAKEMGMGYLACEVAALLQERSPIQRSSKDSRFDIDLTDRWHALHSGLNNDQNAISRIDAECKRLAREIGVRKGGGTSSDVIGTLVSLAYPERISRRRGGSGNRYHMTGGTGAFLPDGSVLAREEFLAFADVDGMGKEARVFLAAPISYDDIVQVFGEKVVRTEECVWSEQEDAVLSRRVEKLDNLTLVEEAVKPSNELAKAAMVEGIVHLGLAALPWDDESLSIKKRSEWLRLRGFVSAGWPNLSDEFLSGSLSRWLLPFLDGIMRKSHLTRLDMNSILRSLFSHAQLKELDRSAPASLTVSTGSRVPLDYSGEVPILAVKLQEMFGQTKTPTVVNGRVNVLIHLLSPAGRPLAVTQDLVSFWSQAYPEVRKQMRGRYPKHPWPENPLTALPTRRTKRAPRKGR